MALPLLRAAAVMPVPGPRSWDVLLLIPPVLLVYALSRLPGPECIAPAAATAAVAAPAAAAAEPVAPGRPGPPPLRRRPEPVGAHIRAAAARHRVPERLVAAVIAVESEFNPRAVSPRGARGLMQLMPATAALLGVKDPFAPRENIDAGARHLRDLLDRYGDDVPLALAAYNAGIGAVGAHGGIPPYPETRAFVARVMSRLGDGPRLVRLARADTGRRATPRERERGPSAGVVGAVRVARLAAPDDGVVIPVAVPVGLVTALGSTPVEAPRQAVEVERPVEADGGAGRASAVQAP